MHGEEKVCVRKEGSLITNQLERLMRKSYDISEISNQLRDHTVSLFGLEFVEDRLVPMEEAPMKNNSEPSVLEALSILNGKLDRSVADIITFLELLKTNV